MTDTHTHLYTDEYEDGGYGAVLRALSRGVWKMIFPNVNLSSIEPMTELHRKFPLQTRISIGLHPTELGDDYRTVLDEMERMLEKNANQFSAIGECGIDLHWDKSNIEHQQDAFSRQYDWAVKYNLPLIIHSRDGLEETLAVISKKSGKRPEMIFHSFTGSSEDVKRIREVCNPYFGINGVVTFKNAASLRESLPEIGLNRIVLETDAPYLAPVPHRGERNESAYLTEICTKIAEIFKIPAARVEYITDYNASRIFR